MFVFGYLCFQLEQFWAKRQSQSNINMSGEFNGCGFIRQHSVSDCEQALPGEEGSYQHPRLAPDWAPEFFS